MKIDKFNFFSDSDFILVFNMTKNEFLEKWDFELQKFNNDFTKFKKSFFLNLTTWNLAYLQGQSSMHEAYYSERAFDNLKKYYSSDAFAYMLLRRAFDTKAVDLYQTMSKFLFPKNERSKIRIINYGCGVSFPYIEMVIEDGFINATFADMPHKTFSLLQSAMEKFNLPVEFIKIESDDVLVKQYDFIICDQVLEHVLEPENIVKEFYEHVSDNGFLYLDVWMDDMNGQDPTHLRINTERYNRPENFINMVKNVGFEPFLFEPDTSTPKMWIKKGEKLNTVKSN